MSVAPKDGTLICLHLREDGSDFIGYYCDKWWGWIDYNDPWPRIRGDLSFLGWEPVDQAAEHRKPLERRWLRRRRGPPVTIVVVPQPAPQVAAQPAAISRIVKAKPPRRRG